MRILVIGGGLQGLCSALVLVERGHRVQLLEARDGVGLESSFANGGLITPSRSEPWNGPGAVRHLLASLFRSSSAFRLRAKALPSLIFWGIDFLKNSTPARQMVSVRANYALATYSRNKTDELRRRLGLHYAAASSGTMTVYRHGEDVASLRGLAEYLSGVGMRYEQLDADGVISIEPALEQAWNLIEGAFYYPDDESGDAYLFCRELLREIVAAGATVQTGTTATGLAVKKGRIVGAHSGAGLIDAEIVVIAAGHGSPALVRPVGLSLPIKPVKGYSLTLDMSGIDPLPRVPLVDETMHAAITPLGNRLRMTSTVEFSGVDRRIDPRRIDALYALLAALYPQIAAQLDRSNVDAWAGFRPVSSDGRPFIGPGGVPGLYVNAGHGPLGWTLAMGSALLLADLIEGRRAEIDGAPFDATR